MQPMARVGIGAWFDLRNLMDTTIQKLTKLTIDLHAEADQNDGYAHGETLSGNVVKEASYKGMAAGLRIAANMVREVLEPLEAEESNASDQ